MRCNNSKIVSMWHGVYTIIARSLLYFYFLSLGTVHHSNRKTDKQTPGRQTDRPNRRRSVKVEKDRVDDASIDLDQQRFQPEQKVKYTSRRPSPRFVDDQYRRSIDDPIDDRPTTNVRAAIKSQLPEQLTLQLATTQQTNTQEIKLASITSHTMTSAPGIFLVAAKRTPFGTFGGALKSFSATDLGTHATQAALSSIDLDPTVVDSIYFGNVIQSSNDAAYLARHVGLRSGMRLDAPSLTINRLCGSGFETVILGAQSITLGQSKIAVCGGAENMSNAPLQVAGNDARWGVKLGTGLNMRDALWDGLTDSYSQTPMGMTAENLAKKYGITREVRRKRTTNKERK
jgi:Thiolase, N-terminal domain